jgi:hypothetical protein
VGSIVVAAAACDARTETASPPATLTSVPPHPQLMFVSLANNDTFHKLSVASFDNPSRGAFITGLSCERVYFGGGRGICLAADTAASKTRWWAQTFDERFQVLERVSLTGEPSRVRVSPDGRLAAATVFETGHSYRDHGFSTRTTLVDLTTGQSLGDLEQFETRRDGRVVREKDFNFWGLTFARDSDTFYATLDTAGVSYLVKGAARARTLEIVKPDVECPSLSPDNLRIAFKKRVGARSRGWWQLTVLRLDTMAETVVSSETRSVDDQVEWLDNERVVYHLSSGTTSADLWSVRVDNSTPPQRMLSFAYSPAVVR